MGFFDRLRSPDINQGVAEQRAAEGSLLLDVRTPEEYREGHIPGSRNVPLQAIGNVRQLAGDPDTPLFLYCHSGARSRQAAAALQGMGYRKIRNLGGITAYQGKVER